MVRRDHSIWPSDRSKTRRLEATKPGGRGAAADGRFVIDQALSSALDGHFTRYWKTACRLSSGDVTSSIAPHSPVAAMLGQPGVELVGLPGLDDHRARLEPQADHVVVRQELARERARVVGADVDRVRVLVDQIADLVDVALGEDPAVVDQQDVRRHRLDLVQDVARDDDALAGARPVADQADRLRRASGSMPDSGSSRMSSSGSWTIACASLTRWRMPLL